MDRLFTIVATTIDPEEFTWKRFNGTRKRTFKGKHQKHQLVLSPGDLYGVKQTRSKTPNFQLLHANKMHILFRNISLSEMESLNKVSKPYKGKSPKLDEVEEGRQRRRRSATVDVETRKPNKLKDSHYKPAKRIPESLVVDKDNYQWRKVREGSKPVVLKSKKQGKVIYTLQPGDVVGLRFVSPSKGGYVILPGGERRNISTEDYDTVESVARILPTRYQKTGIIDQKELKKTVKAEKAPRKMKPIVIEPKPLIEPDVKINTLYDLDGVDDADVLKHVNSNRSTVRTRRHVRKHIADVFDEKAVDEADDLDDSWFVDDTDNKQDEDFDDEVSENEDFDDDVSDADFDDADKQVETETAPTDSKALLSDELEPGDIVEFVQARSRKFVFVYSQPFASNDRLIEYIFAESGSDGDEMYRVRLDDNYTMGDFDKAGASIVGDAEPEELLSFQRGLEYAEVKRMSFFK